MTVRPIRSARSYYLALHELGHAALGHDYPDDIPDRAELGFEIQAWQFAFDTSVIDPTDGVLRMVDRCLNSYRKQFS